VTAPAVVELREKVRQLFEPSARLAGLLREQNQHNPCTGEPSAQVSHRTNATFFRYLDADAFENVLSVLDGPNAAREAANLVTYLRNSQEAWLRIRHAHPRDILESAKGMYGDRERALRLLAETKSILASSFEEAIDDVITRVRKEVWPVRSEFNFEYAIATSYDNETFAPGTDTDREPRTKPTFNLAHVGRRGASSNRESAWRALRIRALDERLPTATVNRNSTIAKLLNLGEEGGITRQVVAAILKEKPKVRAEG